MFAISKICSASQVKSNGPNTVKLNIFFISFSTAYGISSLKELFEVFLLRIVCLTWVRLLMSIIPVLGRLAGLL